MVFTQASSSYKTESEVGYGVASVFTPPHNRGKGYAKHMMRLLHWVLAPAASFSTTFPEEWGQPPAIPEGFGTGVVSVLYSDVGREFYKAAGPVPGEDGWVVGPHVITTWNLATSSLNASNDAVSRWTFLGKEQLQELWERDSELILDETPPNLSSTNKKAFTFLPRKGLGEYLYRRTDWFVNKMESPPKYWGMESKLNVGNTFVSWSYEMYPGHPKTLLVTRLRCPRQMLVELISVLVGYAKELGIDKVQAWNLSDELKEESSKIGGDSVDAEEHLASAKWYGGGDSTVEWLNSEKLVVPCSRFAYTDDISSGSRGVEVLRRVDADSRILIIVPSCKQIQYPAVESASTPCSAVPSS